MTRAQAIEEYVRAAVTSRAEEMRAQARGLRDRAEELEAAAFERQRFLCFPFGPALVNEPLPARLGASDESCRTAARFVAAATGAPVSYVFNDQVITVPPLLPVQP